MFYVKYNGEYSVQLNIEEYVDEDGYSHWDNWLMTDDNKLYAKGFDSLYDAQGFIDNVLEQVDYTYRSEFEIVEGQVEYKNYVRCCHCDRTLWNHKPTSDEDIAWHTCSVFECTNYDCRHYRPKWYVSKEIHTYKGVWYKPWTWWNWEIIKEMG